jgi:hypothetical protein
MCLRRRLNVIWDSGLMSRRTHGPGLCCADAMPASSSSDALGLFVPAASSWPLASAAAAAQPRLRHPPSWAGINHQPSCIKPAKSQPMRNNDIARGLDNKIPRVISGRKAAIDINGSRPAVYQTKKLEKPISPRKRRPASWLNQTNTKLAWLSRVATLRLLK